MTRWNRRFWVMVGTVLVLRVLYAWVFPLDLAPDESYYWDWGRRLDIGYYSKPPMVGWLMGLAGFLGGNTQFGVKVFPAVLATAALVFVYLLGRSMFGARAGFWAAALMVASPAAVALGAFFTIDAPLMLFWSASLYFAWRCLQEGANHSWRNTLLLVACLGLGFLTKQIHCLFPLLYLLALAATAGLRPAAQPVRVAAVVGLPFLFLLPPVLWNWRHDWITFRHTVEELEDRPWQLSRSLKFVGEFLGGQAGLGGGITWILMMLALAIAVRGWRTRNPQGRFLLAFSLPGVLAFLGLSVFQRVEQNWPMVFYVAAAVLAAGWLAREEAPPRAGASALKWAVRLGGFLGVALMLVPFVLPWSPWAGSKSDPTARVRGWRELATAVEPVRRAVPRPERTLVLAPDDRYAASALAFYLPDQPRTFCWESKDRLESQYGIWGRPGAEWAGWDALVIARNPLDAKLKDVAQRFDKWESRGTITLSLGRQKARDRRYVVFVGQGYRPPETVGTGGK
ncbi:MAG: glycosyltransferase family 39 protein [Verrucomicrobiales bacterium]|nr:glycosyltransferase family 39 protein [Verrucomicrobiales bacterium]